MTRALMLQLIKAAIIVAIGGTLITYLTVSRSPDARPYYSVIADKRAANITTHKDTQDEHISGADTK